MRDWIFWTIVGFGCLQFVIIAAMQSVLMDVQGRLKVMADELRKLGAAQGVRLF